MNCRHDHRAFATRCDETGYQVVWYVVALTGDPLRDVEPDNPYTVSDAKGLASRAQPSFLRGSWVLLLFTLIMAASGFIFFELARAPYHPLHLTASLLGDGEVEAAYSLSAACVFTSMACLWTLVARLRRFRSSD